MCEALVPPGSQHIFPSARAIDDKSVVPSSKGDSAFDPGPDPGGVEHVACHTNSAVGENQNNQFGTNEDTLYR